MKRKYWLRSVAGCSFLSISAWVLLVQSVPALADVQLKIDAIEVVGNNRIESSTILAQVSSRVGTPLNRATVQNDIKEIYRTGLFSQVSVDIDSSSGKNVLTIHVVEKPAIRNVFVDGNKEVTSDKLKEQLGLEARRYLDAQKINAGIELAKTYYQGKGYYGTEITFTTTDVENNQVDLTFHVKEGSVKHLVEIVFEGNTEISEHDLLKAMKTSSYNWWVSWLTGSGVVKEENLENDVREITRAYLNKGYVDVKVGEPLVDVTDSGLKVTFKIDEGVVYQIAEITASGDLLDDTIDKTLQKIESKTGEVFNVDKIRKDTFSVTEKFTDIGYAFANVEPGTDIDRSSRTVRINFHINKGSLVTINRINITGNQKTRDNVIRRSLKINERELYSGSKVRQSEQLLKRLGYFDEVTITPEPITTPGEIDLSLNVREGQTGTFSAGAGVSSGEGFIFNARVSEQNLFGSGNALTLEADNGTKRQNYVLSFDNPRVNDTRYSMGLDLLSVKRIFNDFDRSQAGGSVTLGYPLWFLGPEYLDDVRFAVTYELLRIKIDNVKTNAPQLILDQQGSSTSSAVTPKLMRNTIDNPLNPTSGSNQRLSMELAGAGGDQQFWLFQASNTLYHPLFDSPFGPFVFSQRLKFGFGRAFDGENFPLYRRFFPGGIDSVRGFQSRQLGPKDPQGNEYGGSKEVIGNFEMIFPILSTIGFKGLVFYDVGNAFDDQQNMSIGDLRQAAGWGFRWSSPLGPIRIEFGYPLDSKPGDKGVVTNFSFGAPL